MKPLKLLKNVLDSLGIGLETALSEGYLGSNNKVGPKEEYKDCFNRKTLNLKLKAFVPC